MVLVTMSQQARRLISRRGTTSLFVAPWLLCVCICAESTRVAAQYRFDSWTTDNGLPQASVNSIVQTRDGFLWLATYGGLVRYDGLRFQVFNTLNTPGLRTSRFVQAMEDNEVAYG